MGRSSSDGFVALAVIIAFVIIAIQYLVIALGIGLLLFGLFLLFKALYIGKANEKKTDPLFTKAAKEAVKKKRFNPSEFTEKHSLSSERINYITTLLSFAGVISDGTVLIDNQWKLRSVFHQINTEDDFFLSKVNEQILTVQETIDKQIRNESNEIALSILSKLRDNVKQDKMTDYLSLKLSAIQDFCSQDEINKYEDLIKSYSLPTEPINIDEDDKTIEAFEVFISLINTINEKRMWDPQHKLISIQSRSFRHLTINGQMKEVPFIEREDFNYFFYPSFVITYRINPANFSFRIVDYNNITILTRSYTEKKGAWFDYKDAKEAYSTWLHTCKDGSPDLRYKHNPSYTYYHFYAAKFTGIALEILSGDSSIIDAIERAFAILTNTYTSAKIDLNSGNGAVFLGYHEWKDIPPSQIRLEDASVFPNWEQIEIYSRKAIINVDRAIQESYFAIRNDFLNGKYYDLSEPGKINYGFVLLYDLVTAYSTGRSDIVQLCKELDVLTISCGKTGRYLKKTLYNCFKVFSKPQRDREYAAAYFNFEPIK